MGRRPRKILDLRMPFAEALERFIRVDPKELPDPPEGEKKARRKAAKRKKGTTKNHSFKGAESFKKEQQKKGDVTVQ